MFKKILILLLIISGGIAFTSREAYADKEIVQKVLKKTDVIEKQGIFYLEEYQKIKRKVQKTVTGVKQAITTGTNFVTAVANGDLVGAVSAGTSLTNQISQNLTGKDLVEGKQISAATAIAGNVSSLITNPMETLKTKIPSFISDVKDLKKTKKNVEENVVPENTQQENPTAYAEQQNKIDDLQRQNVSSFYAKALAMRVQIAKDKAATPAEIDTTNERALIQASVMVTTTTAQRLARILELEAAMYEYETTQSSRNFIRMEEESDTDTDTPQTPSSEEEK